MLNVIMVNVIMLNVIMLNVIMLSVMAPFLTKKSNAGAKKLDQILPKPSTKLARIKTTFYKLSHKVAGSWKKNFFFQFVSITPYGENKKALWNFEGDYLVKIVIIISIERLLMVYVSQS